MATNVRLYPKLTTKPWAIIDEQVYLEFQVGNLSLYDFSSKENADNLALVSLGQGDSPDILSVFTLELFEIHLGSLRGQVHPPPGLFSHEDHNMVYRHVQTLEMPYAILLIADEKAQVLRYYDTRGVGVLVHAWAHAYTLTASQEQTSTKNSLTA